jgi:uncharacterized membrane-anchored protein YhcB (DUF1043 family)
MTMNGDHPWRDWLYVIAIFVAGLFVVMVVVRLVIKWAQKNDRSESGTDTKRD